MAEEDHQNIWGEIRGNTRSISRLEVEVQRLRGTMQEEISLRKVNHNTMKERMIDDHKRVNERLEHIEVQLKEIDPILKNIVFLFKLFASLLASGAALVLIVEYFN